MDIDPPSEQPQLSPEELQSLGLPVTHVHYDVNKQLTSSAEHHEELLAPSDIKVTYSGMDWVYIWMQISWKSSLPEISSINKFLNVNDKNMSWW